MTANRRRIAEYLVVVIVAVIATTGILAATGRLSSGAAASPSTPSTLDQIHSRGTLRAGIPIIGLPVAQRDTSGNIVGFLPDLYAEMAKALGVKLQIVDTTAANRIPFLQTGQIDVTTGTITLDRLKVVNFAGVWDMDSTSVAYLRSSGIQTVNDIKGKRIVSTTGSTGEMVATKLFPNNPIQRVDAASTSIQTVLSGQADVVFEDRTILSQAVAVHPELVLGPPLTTEPSGLMIRQGDQKWANWLKAFLDDFYFDGIQTCGCGGALYIKWHQAPHLQFNFTY